jgi:hypothetical protein
MGGVGSGRQANYWHKYVDDCERLDISQCWVEYPDEGAVSWAGYFPVEWTPQHLGGCRSWFLCPGCGRRCRVLHAPRNLMGQTEPWRCRECHGLKYERQYRQPHLYTVGQLAKASRALDIRHPAPLLITPPEYVKRPKGMHRKTFEVKLAAYRAAYENFKAALGAFCGREMKHLDRIEASLRREGREDGA